MKRTVIHFLGITALILFLVSLAIAITINFTPLYRFDLDYLGIVDYVDMPKETILKNYHSLMSYLNSPWITSLKMPDFVSSKDGLFHFSEAKRLFLLDYGILIVSGIGSFFFLRYLKAKELFWILIRPFQVALVFPVILVFFITVNFEQLFITFHELLFNNDAWLFDPLTDPIIDALPEEFFMHCFILAIVLIELQFFIGYLLSKRTLTK